MADMDLACTVVTEHTADVICLTATFGSELGFWMIWVENLGDAIWEVTVRVEDS